MLLDPTYTRAASALLAGLLLVGCGGGDAGGEEVAAACEPAHAVLAVGEADRAAGQSAQVERPVPKRDPRELSTMTAAQAGLVALLHEAESGTGAVPALPQLAATHEGGEPAGQPVAEGACSEPAPEPAPEAGAH